MKNFNQLTVGDYFYSVYHENMKYEKQEVQKVDSADIHFTYSKTIPRFKDKEGIKREYSRFNDGHKNYYFTSEADAIRFCKARLMKNLFNIIESAKRNIKSLREFRLEHWELLNHQWTETQINILENSL